MTNKPLIAIAVGVIVIMMTGTAYAQVIDPEEYSGERLVNRVLNSLDALFNGHNTQESKISNLEGKITTLETRVDDLQNTPIVTPTGEIDLEPLYDEINNLEIILDELQIDLDEMKNADPVVVESSGESQIIQTSSVGPVGAQGEIGPQGEQGIQGEQGESGMDGVTPEPFRSYVVFVSATIPGDKQIQDTIRDDIAPLEWTGMIPCDVGDVALNAHMHQTSGDEDSISMVQPLRQNEMFRIGDPDSALNYAYNYGTIVDAVNTSNSEIGVIIYQVCVDNVEPFRSANHDATPDWANQRP